MMSGIKISEVGPRDGLQNMDYVMPTADKYRWIKALAAVLNVAAPPPGIATVAIEVHSERLNSEIGDAENFGEMPWLGLLPVFSPCVADLL